MVTTDDFASWFFRDSVLEFNWGSVGVKGLSGSEVVGIQAWFCLNEGTELRAGTSGGWMDADISATYLFLAASTGWKS